MQKISAVIVCKDEEEDIGYCLQSLHGLTDDIVVLDNGSTDRTKEIVASSGAKLIEGVWNGYGKTKNKAGSFAKYDWILSLDADEAIDATLKNSLAALKLDNENEVFEIRFKNFLGDKLIRFGEWGNDWHIRIFNRNKIRWDEEAVHEKLLLPEKVKISRMKGFVIHHTVKTVSEYFQKMTKYALLNAEKYAANGKKSSWIKIYLSPVFSFINYYFLRLGFLDGRAGFLCAKMTSYYTYKKYARLLELNKQREM